MNLEEFTNSEIKKQIGINDDFGRIYSFIDFGNVTYWFSDDIKNIDGEPLKDGEKLNIDFQKLNDFSNIFSINKRFYYGINSKNKGSAGFIFIAKKIFGKHNVFTKEIQQIKHYLNSEEFLNNTRAISEDRHGKFIYIPKCNFDVEICVDTIKLLDKYDTICLFSSDSDFTALLRFLKNKGKKVILIKGGFAQHELVDLADLLINAQDIKQHITFIKQKSST